MHDMRTIRLHVDHYPDDPRPLWIVTLDVPLVHNRAHLHVRAHTREMAERSARHHLAAHLQGDIQLVNAEKQE